MNHKATRNAGSSRIFIGTSEVAGYYTSLARGFKELSIPVTFFSRNDHPFQYDTQRYWWLLRLAKYAQRRSSQTPRRHSLQKAFWFCLTQMAMVAVLLWAVARHDVFIFGFGESFIYGGYDLWFLKKLKKTIISNIAHGSEARPPYIDGAYQSTEGTPAAPHLIYNQTVFIKKRVERIERASDYIIGAPYSCHFLRRAFINTVVMGVPWQFDTVEKEGRPGDAYDAIRILHAPSHRAVKGTDTVRQVISQLKAKGYNIEFVEITGRPHQEVLQELEKCTFVVDQIYSDGLLPGFATEAAWFCRPSVVGGYGLTELRHLLQGSPLPPSQICRPTELEEAIEKLIAEPERRMQLGAGARDFITTHWSARQVAGRFARLIAGDAPPEWFIHPSRIVYLHGVGLSESNCKAQIRKVIEQYGVEALQLSHRPDLETAFVQFAGSEASDVPSQTLSPMTS